MLLLDHLRNELPPLCQQFGIGSVEVFGSVARQEEKPESDIDLLIEFAKDSDIPYNDRYFGFQFALEDKYNRNVDILTASTLRNPYLISEIEPEKLRIYG